MAGTNPQSTVPQKRTGDPISRGVKVPKLRGQTPGGPSVRGGNQPVPKDLSAGLPKKSSKNPPKLPDQPFIENMDQTQSKNQTSQNPPSEQAPVPSSSQSKIGILKHSSDPESNSEWEVCGGFDFLKIPTLQENEELLRQLEELKHFKRKTDHLGPSLGPEFWQILSLQPGSFPMDDSNDGSSSSSKEDDEDDNPPKGEAGPSTQKALNPNYSTKGPSAGLSTSKAPVASKASEEKKVQPRLKASSNSKKAATPGPSSSKTAVAREPSKANKALLLLPAKEVGMKYACPKCYKDLNSLSGEKMIKHAKICGINLENVLQFDGKESRLKAKREKEEAEQSDPGSQSAARDLISSPDA